MSNFSHDALQRLSQALINLNLRYQQVLADTDTQSLMLQVIFDMKIDAREKSVVPKEIESMDGQDLGVQIQVCKHFAERMRSAILDNQIRVENITANLAKRITTF